MDTLLSMRVFREVIESGTFVTAAERLSLSTASASKHLMSLEKRLGVRLLNRSTRRQSLTEAGQIYFERCKAILEDLDQAESAIGSYGLTARGTVRISCPSWMAIHPMAEFIAAHRVRYPDVVVDVNFDDRFTDVGQEGYDVALRITRGALPRGVVARRMRVVPFVVATSAAYLKRRGMPKSPQELASHDSVMIGGGQSWHFQGSGGFLEVPARVISRSASAIGAAHTLSKGIGIAPLPSSMLENPPFQGLLCSILEDYPLHRPTLFAFYERRGPQPMKIRTFVDHLTEVICEQPVKHVQPQKSSSPTRDQSSMGNLRACLLAHSDGSTSTSSL